MIDRRTFCASALGALVARPADSTLRTLSDWRRSVSTSALLDDPLRALAASKGFQFGSAAGRPVLSRDSAYADLIVRECAVLTPEGELKWRALRPSPSAFRFDNADWMLSFCSSHGLAMRGHVLVWNLNLPDWFASYVTPSNAGQVLSDHITTVVSHYAGKLPSWDVVNEVINPRDGRPDGLKNGPWLQLLGPDYIPQAFRLARAADPKALLVYNEVALEYNYAEHEQRRQAVLQLLEKLMHDGVPIQALGMQAHLYAQETRFDPNVLSTFLKRVGDLGLKILITEMDVSDSKLPADVGARDARVAQVYGDFLAPVVENPSVISIQTWGLADQYSWLIQHTPRADGLPVRPLPFDANLQPTPAYAAIVRALSAARPRNAQ